MTEPRRPPGDAAADLSTPLRGENADTESPATRRRRRGGDLDRGGRAAYPSRREELVVGVASPRDQRRRASLPWLAAALILAGAALAVAYLVFFRPPQE